MEKNVSTKGASLQSFRDKTLTNAHKTRIHISVQPLNIFGNFSKKVNDIASWLPGVLSKIFDARDVQLELGRRLEEIDPDSGGKLGHMVIMIRI